MKVNTIAWTEVCAESTRSRTRAMRPSRGPKKYSTVTPLGATTLPAVTSSLARPNRPCSNISSISALNAPASVTSSIARALLLFVSRSLSEKFALPVKTVRPSTTTNLSCMIALPAGRRARGTPAAASAE